MCVWGGVCVGGKGGGGGWRGLYHVLCHVHTTTLTPCTVSGTVALSK